MTEPAVIRIEVHLRAIAHDHCQVVHVAELDQKRACHRFFFSKETLLSADVYAYLSEQSDDKQLAAEQERVWQ